MSDLLRNFLAARATRGAPPKNPIMNDAPQVTRGEFNTLVRAVEALVQDVEAATSPEKLREIFNAALEPLANAAAPKPGAKGGLHQYRVPSDDDDTPVTNQRQDAARKGKFLLPEGD